MPRVQRKYRKGEIIDVEITGFAFGGKGIAKVPTEQGDFTVFVQNSLPGQHVKARVIKCKNRFAECKLEAVVKPAPTEVEIPYQPIPGAPYARLPIEEQLKLKEQTALELYKRIGNLEIAGIYEGMLASPMTWHYRNKMEYSFSAIGFDLASAEEFDGFALGFKHRGTWWKVENLDADSGLFDAELENGLKELRQFFEASGLPPWHPPKREGFYRFFVVRRSLHANKLLLNLVTTSDDLDQFDTQGFIDLCVKIWGERIQGILHTINDDKGERVEARSGSSSVIYGEEKVIERINGLDFEISMSSFFQTNPKSAEKLYSLVVDFAGKPATEDAFLMDLFCGTGTIGQLLAKGSGAKVIGVDIVESSIEDAKENAKRNGVENVEFYAAAAGKFLREYPEYIGKIDTIVLDPPRAGIAPKTLRKVIELGARRIVYVSCNPSTQARDAATLSEAGYEMKRLKLVDQFPHTSHVEAIAQFDKA
ncbi:MAG: 23S rRNA (uracil(1939)-C(5))-methyltransferase RlmD [Flavobacteriales bacterium]|nr:23S rRNA (uracil(1939)-C(5))-methyltransferase RlmD [Flavobacteriales bacterium]